MVEPGKECKPALDRAVTLAENNQANLTVITVASSISVSVGLVIAAELLELNVCFLVKRDLN